MRISHRATVAAASFAATDALGADAALRGVKPPASSMALSHLGKAGLLRSHFESDQFGSVQWRIGQGRVAIGAAGSSRLPNSHCKDGTTDIVEPLNFMFGLPGGVRADFLNEFSEHRGVAAKVEYSWGQLDLKINVGFGLITEHTQGDDHLHTQAELIGQYRNEDFAITPENCVFHPVLGTDFQRSFFESTANSFDVVSSCVVGPTEDNGKVWAHMRLEKEVPPGGWSPNLLLGMEQEFVNDLDDVVDDRTHEISCTRNQCLEGRSWNQAIVGALAMNF